MDLQLWLTLVELVLLLNLHAVLGAARVVSAVQDVFIRAHVQHLIQCIAGEH